MNITLATKITISRILLVIPTAAFFIAGQLEGKLHLAFMIVATVIFSILCISDFVDGYVARKTNTVSDLGKFLDPVADKIVVAVMLSLIICFNDGLSLDGAFRANVIVIAALFGMVMAREFTIGMLRSMSAQKGKVIPSDILGKIKTTFMNTGVIVLLLAGVHVAFAYIGTILIYIGSIMTAVSGVHYIVKNKDVLKYVKEGE